MRAAYSLTTRLRNETHDMGIPSRVAHVILREHRFRPISGKLLSVGKQIVQTDAAPSTGRISAKPYTISFPSVNAQLSDWSCRIRP